MSAINAALTRALRQRQAANTDPAGNPLCANWNGTDYPCTASELSTGQKLVVGGVSVDADLTVDIVFEDFTNGLPQPKQTLLYPGAAGKRYRILQIISPPGCAFLSLVCQSDSKGS